MRYLGLLIAVLSLSGCDGCSGPDEKTVTIYTSVDQVFSEPVFNFCEQKTGLKVRAVFDTEETKSTGVLNRLIAEAKQPQADVFWSGDPVRPFVLIDRGLVEPYRSDSAAGLPAVFQAKDGTWTGFAARARVLLVNTDRVAAEATPTSIKDLAAPRWKGKTAIANPLFGTTTIHVAALHVAWGQEKTRAFLAALKNNKVRIASSNGEVKRLVVSGEVAFGLTDTDDAHEAIKAGAPVTVIYPDRDDLGTLVMPTSVVLIRNGPQPKAGQLMIDCLLSGEVEKRMATAAAHMPLRDGLEIPKTVRSLSDIRGMQIDYARVAKEMEQIQPWLRTWVGL